MDGQLSLQKHNKRAEIWYIDSGLGVMTIDEDHFTVQSGDAVQIEVGQVHRIKNIGDSPLIIYEVQVGECSEDDIIRIEDIYNRQ